MQLVKSSFIKNIFFIVVLTLLYANEVRTQGAVPSIASFSPASGPIGASVTINGANFNSIPANNIVYFGPVKAVVTSASSTSLTVNVPVGATYQPLSVTDVVTGLTAYSNAPFVTTFTGSTTIRASSFASNVDFLDDAYSFDIAISDLDGDGKTDVVVSNSSNNTLSIYRNISISGTISSGSFAAKVNVPTGNNPMGVVVSDIDGDGKPDIIVCNGGEATVSVYRNMSTSGSISFAPRVNFQTGAGVISLAIGDLDRDGKPDIVTANNTSISVLRNISTIGSTSFASGVHIPASGNPYRAAIKDIDGDGKPDIVITNNTINSVSVYQNIGTGYGISSGTFALPVYFATGENPIGVAVGDVDGDGKMDMVVANVMGNTISVFQNIGTTGNITTGSFAPKVDFSTASATVNNPYDVALCDLNGDGKPEIVTANSTSEKVSIFLNICASGNVTLDSFAPKVDISTGLAPYGLKIGDIDGDGKPDILTANYFGNSFSISRNLISPDQPPIAKAGPDQTVTVGTQVILNGSASSDPDGDVLSYLWQEGGATLGTAPQITVSLPVGIHTITLTVNDNNGGTCSDIVVVTVLATINHPPVANAGSDQTVNEGVQVTLNGSASSDPDGDALTYSWNEGTNILGTGVQLAVTLPVGTHTITLVVSDGHLTASDDVIINVVAAAPPTIVVKDTHINLWPANHKYVNIKVADIVVSANDSKGLPIEISKIRIASVSSDEPENVPGDGNTYNDIVISNDAKCVNLRAERQDWGNGRVYTINLIVLDANGNKGQASYEVWVPKSQGAKNVINDGVAYTVEASSLGKNVSELSLLESDQPSGFKLYDNYPNPFNPSTEISFAIQENNFVSLKVYDLLGHEVATLVNDQLSSGLYSIQFNANRLSSGTYIYRLIAGTSVQTKRMLLMK
ncbi:MAG: FG-GAP-like repeat-containing protein [Ignavibacteriales bacterium]|nr:FG-GAP-like repeat-containing protein [Ignavibacteriales bacterium]